MIRITITYKTTIDEDGRKETRIKIKEFEDDAEARKWLIEDSYFAEDYVKSALWERIG